MLYNIFVKDFKSLDGDNMKHEKIYLNENDKRVFIDTYVANSKEKRPAILVIPGGGYSNVCTEREGEPIALDFFARGYNAFVLNYRVGKDGDVYPAQLFDAASAMIYIRKNADELSVDPKRVFAVGFSAGGHLCGCLATMYAYPEIKCEFTDDSELIKPTGAILSYPVTIAYGSTHQGSFLRLLGKPLSEYTEGEINKLSLDRAVTSDTAPMFIWHTAEDAVVPVIGSLMLAVALTNAKVPYKMSIYPYGPHGVALSNSLTRCGNDAWVQPLAEGWTREADEWMKTL